ncbi:MAG: L-serine ammonia-lyase [bacterium]
MNISIFDLYTVGIGPSSSHTIGPMRASKFFLEKLIKHNFFDDTQKITIELYGALAATGKGHGTDKALLIGLCGFEPEKIDPEDIPSIVDKINLNKKLTLLGKREITFDPQTALIYKSMEQLPYHTNGMLFKAYNNDNKCIYEKTYYSTGGGFLVGAKAASLDKLVREDVSLPYKFRSADELLQMCKRDKLSISQIVLKNDEYWRSQAEIYKRLLFIWETMQKSVISGYSKTGILPGSLQLPRRAHELYKKLKANYIKSMTDPLSVMDWVDLYALAVNEENASGGRVVTAPTNGAAGILPSVMHYYMNFFPGSSTDGIFKILLTAGGIGLLYKTNASISGAEVGCQGEVGVACSMAAGGLTEAMGGTPEQVENAAEIAMEHNLGLTCDPIGGLVQIPCIERNAMGAVKAINASRIALKGDGTHYVSLDKVIKTMQRTGLDMQAKYKETSTGGLAVNITEC